MARGLHKCSENLDSHWEPRFSFAVCTSIWKPRFSLEITGYSENLSSHEYLCERQKPVLSFEILSFCFGAPFAQKSREPRFSVWDERLGFFYRVRAVYYTCGITIKRQEPPRSVYGFIVNKLHCHEIINDRYTLLYIY